MVGRVGIVTEVKTKLRRLRLERKMPVWLVTKKAEIAVATLLNVETLKQHAGARVQNALAKFYDVPRAELFNEGMAETPVSEPDARQDSEPQELAPDSTAIDEDGNLHFGDNFFGELGRDIEPELSGGTGTVNPDRVASEAALYTPDEIASTHFSQIDVNRLPEAARPYLTVVQQRLQQLEGELAQYRAAVQQANAARIQANAPKEYTPDEIAAASKTLTAQQLGVAEDELDFYDPKVIALQAVNAQKVVQGRAAEIQNYQAQVQGQAELGAFYSAIAGRPEAKAFDQYLTQKFAESGVTPEAFTRYVQQNGMYAQANQTVRRLYQEFMQSQVMSVKPSQGRAAQVGKPVPFVEGAGAESGAARKPKRDLTNLSIMSDEEQAQVFKEYGLM